MQQQITHEEILQEALFQIKTLQVENQDLQSRVLKVKTSKPPRLSKYIRSEATLSNVFFLGLLLGFMICIVYYELFIV